jgi:hypothetical protein
VCLFDGFVKYDYVRSIVMDSSISYYGPVIIVVVVVVVDKSMGSR